jgi:hypothetical protein
VDRPDDQMAARTEPDRYLSRQESVGGALRYYELQTYDMVSFPALAVGTDIGYELTTVDVHRVSPEDATSIVDERGPDGRKKLAGEALGHFGAFFGEDFRRNDILWGRLDGAERLITVLLPDGDKDAEKETLRNDLIKKAHIAILKEELKELDAQAINEVLTLAWEKKASMLPKPGSVEGVHSSLISATSTAEANVPRQPAKSY